MRLRNELVAPKGALDQQAPNPVHQKEMERRDRAIEAHEVQCWRESTYSFSAPTQSPDRSIYYYYFIMFNVCIEPIGYGRLIIHGFVPLLLFFVPPSSPYRLHGL